MNFDQFDIIPLQTPDDEGPKRAKRADAIANRELILETAQSLFEEQGIANVGMAAISEAAGVGKGTLYRSFANKGELCLALMDEDMRHFQNETLRIFRQTHEQPALTRLDTFLDRLVRFMDRHAPLLCEVQKQGVLQSDPYVDPASPQMWLPWVRDTITALLQQAQQNGETPELDLTYLVDAILAPLNADLFLYQRSALGFELERISRNYRHLILGGCKSVRFEPGSDQG